MKNFDPHSPFLPLLLPRERRRLRPQLIAIVGALLAVGGIGAVVINAQGSPSAGVAALSAQVAALTPTATSTPTTVATPAGIAATAATTPTSVPPTATLVATSVAAPLAPASVPAAVVAPAAQSIVPALPAVAPTDAPPLQPASVPVSLPTATWTPLPSATPTATPTLTPVRTATPLPTATPSPMPTTASLPSGSTGLTALEQQMFDSHNVQRAQNGGLPALRVDSQLEAIARYRAKDMATRNYFSHYSPDNATTAAYQILLTQNNVSYSYAGENIGENNYPDAQTVAEAMDGFMNSPGHRENILRPQFTRVGIGEALGANGYKYFAVVFAGP